MKFIALFLLVIPFVVSCQSNDDAKDELINNVKAEKTYQLIWSDEFDYSGKPNPKKWNHETGFIRNEELQLYTDNAKNSRVENGILILEGIKEQVENPEFKSENDPNWKFNRKFADYTAASIETHFQESWQYGKFEIKAKLPKGKGQWPAIWMLGNNINEVGWPKCGEIDIMEHVGFEPDKIYGTVHTEAFNHTRNTDVGNSTIIQNPYSKFHVYSIIWTPEIIEFYVDDKKYHEFKNRNETIAEWPFDQKFYLKLNMAIGGAWGGLQGVDDSMFPQKMIVDYVRVYQLK